jgi:hypothetical protein
MFELLDGEKINFTIQDIVDFASEPSPHDQNELWNKILIENIKQNCTSDMIEYTKFLKLLPKYNYNYCSSEAGIYIDQLFELIEQKLMPENSEQRITKLQLFEAEILNGNSSGNEVETNSISGKIKQSVVGLKLKWSDTSSN